MGLFFRLSPLAYLKFGQRIIPEPDTNQVSYSTCTMRGSQPHPRQIHPRHVPRARRQISLECGVSKPLDQFQNNYWPGPLTVACLDCRQERTTQAFDHLKRQPELPPVRLIPAMMRALEDRILLLLRGWIGLRAQQNADHWTEERVCRNIAQGTEWRNNGQ